LIQNELLNDFLLRLYLQHFQHQTHERSRLALSAVGAAYKLEVNGLIDKSLGRQSKTMFFPVSRIVDLLPRNFLNQELRICAV
jgi:hypothetical protein